MKAGQPATGTFWEDETGNRYVVLQGPHEEPEREGEWGTIPAATLVMIQRTYSPPHDCVPWVVTDSMKRVRKAKP